MFGKLKLSDTTVAKVDWKMTPDLAFVTFVSQGLHEQAHEPLIVGADVPEDVEQQPKGAEDHEQAPRHLPRPPIGEEGAQQPGEPEGD